MTEFVHDVSLGESPIDEEVEKVGPIRDEFDFLASGALVWCRHVLTIIVDRL
jgi:hypothetical protein